jgi:hypothetical protein
MAKQISEERKTLYNAGLVMMIIGGCLFALPFLAIPIVIVINLIGLNEDGPNGFPKSLISVPIAFVGAFIGFGLIAAGGTMRAVAARGTAGSGLVLDPEKAREDLKPWTGMAGGMVKDVMDEADIHLDGSQSKKVVMIRCPYCKKLNEEDSKFCQECGKGI